METLPRDLEDAARKRLIGLGDGDVTVIGVLFSSVEDALGEPAWRVQLELPKPKSRQWDSEKTTQLRRQAVRAFDDIVTEHGRDLPGLTLATLTTHKAELRDIATDDGQELGEGAPRKAVTEGDE